MYHKIASMSRFCESHADEYAREYGEYFQNEYKKFEKDLDTLKREIQMSELMSKTGMAEPLSAGLKK